jgi:putative Mg2+ transporter-C (MgtC) family protein
MVLRLVLSVALSGIVGLQRELGRKPAGLRTHILVGLGSTVFMILSVELLRGTGIDPTRIAAAVITGMGFLGAGTIFRTQGTIHGLTTAASLWVIAGIGMAVGVGYYLLALIAAALAFIVLQVFGIVENFFERGRKSPSDDSDKNQ